VIDNNQTTWREFGCFVALPNTFVCKTSQQRHSGNLFQARRPFGNSLQVWSLEPNEGSVRGTWLAKT
jgi:hypothetical protein